MSKPDPVDPIAMLMAQLAVQNVVIEYLLATITGSLDQTQRESTHKAILTILRDRIAATPLNSPEMLKLSEEILGGMINRTNEMLAQDTHEH
ncbi:MAG: hypothetical protein JWN94_2564 [Betaproteobacteria bacterium]|nr:hypothetical protein [Betaproteobacteria bacterium]